MTTFQDGPAKGQRLNLRRTPILLRVTEADGKWDALNEVGDAPRPDEKLHAYVLTAHHGSAFVDGAKFRGRVEIATYQYIATGQPTDATMRHQASWEAWCDLNDPRK